MDTGGQQGVRQKRKHTETDTEGRQGVRRKRKHTKTEGPQKETFTCLHKERVQMYQDEMKSNIENRETMQITTTAERINDDPKFDVSTSEGTELQALWEGNVVLTDAYQGSGKTYWVIQVLVNQLIRFPEERVVFLCPFTSLTTAVVGRLQAALDDAILQRRIISNRSIIVRQYQEKADNQQEWNVLVAHPRSLQKYSFKGVSKIIIDEACTLLRQTGSWENPDEATRLSINGCTEIMRKLVAQADWLMMSCAQMTNEDREMLFTLLGVPPEAKVIQYSNMGLGPYTPVVDVVCPNVLRYRIWEDVVVGRRVVVCVRHARDVDKLNMWLKKMVLKHNKDHNQRVLYVSSVGWTAAWRDSRRDSPARDVTGWLSSHGIQVLFYTNGLSPGISIDHELGYWHRVYMYISNRGGGAESRVLAQLARRVRQPQDRTLHVYAERIHTPNATFTTATTAPCDSGADSGGSSSSSSSSSSTAIATLSKRAVAAVLAENRNERQLDLDEHCRVIDVLKPGALNDVQLQLMYEKLESSRVVQTQDVVKFMGNASITSTDLRTMKPSECWIEVLAEDTQVVEQTMHLANDELPNPDDWNHGTFPAVHLRARRYNHIANTLPPEFITKQEYRLAYSLAPAAFAIIDERYRQLMVVQEIASSNVETMLRSIDLYAHAEELTGGKGLYTDGPTRQVVAAICALVTMVSATGQDTSAITKGLAMDMTVPVISPFGICAPRTNRSGESSSSSSSSGSSSSGSGSGSSRTLDCMARKWVIKNWQKIRTLPSKNFQLPVIVPQEDETDQWNLCLQRILKEHTGMSWRKQKRNTKFNLTPLSMWSKLGINVLHYVEWLRSPHATRFGIIQKTSIHRCTECDGAGDEVLCLRQSGSWRCIHRQTADSWPHRQPFHPLDVYPARTRKKDNKKHRNRTREVVHAPASTPKQPCAVVAIPLKENSNTDDVTIIDRLVRSAGFLHGTLADTPGVSQHDMGDAWSAAIVSQDDRTEIMRLYNVDLGVALNNKTHTKKLRSFLRIILKSKKLTIITKRSRVDKMLQSRMYYLSPLPA
jgi:hypothetical protein